MPKQRRSPRNTVATKSDLRRLRASVDRAPEQIVVTNAISLKRALKMIRDLERRIQRVKKASPSR